MTFADLGLSPELLKAIEEAGYLSPTPIQEQAIPVVLMGRDVLGVAQTGTGKTAGFTLPMIEILSGSRARARMPRSLILAPTRELAAQVAENFEKYGKYHRLSMALLIGGESFADQEKLLDRGVDVLIATPGRLMDQFDRGRILLNDIKVLVIDEADRMLDMGFIPDVERIVSLLPKIRQTLFFSATMAPEIRRLADAFLMNPKEIAVATQATTAANVKTGLVVCDEMDKREALRHLLRQEDVKNAFIFCNRKRDVDILYRSLTKHGFSVAQLHGDMPQSARTETLDRFRKGDVALMVCSDVAARGIDISNVSHVFNFDVPHHPEDYVHRIGRTGRAGKEGVAYSIASPDDGKFIGAIVKLTGKEIPRVELEGLPPGLELDPEGKGHDRRRKGREGEKRGRDRSKKDDRPERAERAERADRPDRPERPERAERPERPERAERPERSERRSERDRSSDPRFAAQPLADHQVERLAGESRSEPLRGGAPLAPFRGGRDAQGNRDAGRAPNGRDQGRDRRRRDEFGIGEMEHSDRVAGFGAHIPDFMLIPIVLPSERGRYEDDLPVQAAASEEVQAAPVVVISSAAVEAVDALVDHVEAVLIDSVIDAVEELETILDTIVGEVAADSVAEPAVVELAVDAPVSVDGAAVPVEAVLADAVVADVTTSAAGAEDSVSQPEAVVMGDDASAAASGLSAEETSAGETVSPEPQGEAMSAPVGSPAEPDVLPAAAVPEELSPVVEQAEQPVAAGTEEVAGEPESAVTEMAEPQP